MPKSNCILNRTTNALLDLFSKNRATQIHASESELARVLDVSRTTIHTALQRLATQGIIAKVGRTITLTTLPKTSDYFTDSQTMTSQDRIEQVLMDRMRQGDWGPRCEFSETDLARHSGVSTASVREFLIGFSRFHMVERRSRGGWKLLGLDVLFADEVADMRQMIEMEAMTRLTAAITDDCLKTAQGLLDRHNILLADMSVKYKDFRALDREFHLWIISHLRNRFATDYLDIVSFVFYYHYKWNMRDELFFNTTALKEHLSILKALLDRNLTVATQELDSHLATSRTNLILSLKPQEPEIPAKVR